jgi:glycosyltransferase involved in cell wall biosynthesis
VRAAKALLVAHGFPPAGGSGSNRALAFARYLPAFGWRPIVLTPAIEWAVNRDDRLLLELPKGLRVVRTASLEPAPQTPPPPSESPAETRRIGSFRRQLGHAKRFPDAHVGWLPYAIAAARKLDFDLIYSSSGPFTSHLVGLTLHRFTRKPWVAELRDGWYRWNRAIFPDYPAWRDALEQRLESAAIRDAARVVLVTERMANAFRCQYAHLPPTHFSVVANGFDPAQMGDHAVEARGGFEIVHAGALYYGRSLANFLEAACAVAESDPRFKEQLKLTLIGTLDRAARAEISQHRLGDRVSMVGQKDHAATIAAMRRANVLLLVANTTDGAEAAVPGKLFEYLAVGRPVLAIAPPDSASADVVADTRGGWLAPAGDIGAIAEALRSAFRGPAPQPDARAIARYDRRVLTSKLARVFDEVLAAHRL